MPFWFLLVLFAAQFILGELMRPKVQDTSKPASLKDFSVPTADENRSVPVGWGTFLMDGANVTWYGDLKTVKLTRKVKTGLLSSTRAGIGFRYSIGMQLAMCHGPVDALLEVRTADKVAFTGNVTNLTGDNGEEFVVDARTIYGGDSDEQLQSGGTGGVYASCTFYRGTGTQNANPYFESVLGVPVPAQRGVCYVMWKGPSSNNLVYNYDLYDHSVFIREPFLSGYVGTSQNMQNIAFVLKRLPNFLSGEDDTFYNINSGDANPADVLFELLTNDEWGMGLPPELVDVPSFKAVQQKLYTEGLGFSGIWDSPRQITDVMNEILLYIDGAMYPDLTTGLMTLKLARDDYEIDNIPLLDESSIVEITDFSRGSWNETTNEVIISYVDRFQKFKDKTAAAHDVANHRIQGDIISSKTSYLGISNQATATKIASRDLQQLTIPLIKCTIKVNRKAYKIRPADVFKVVWPDYDVAQVIFRAIRVRYGELENGQMEIDCIQDVFSLGESIYGIGTSSEWTNPVIGAEIPTLFEVFEAPYFYTGDAQRIQVVAKQPNDGQLAYNTYTASDIGASYLQVATGGTYTPTGTLDASYSALTADVDVTNTLVVTPASPDAMSFLTDLTPEIISNGENLFIISNGTKYEVLAFEDITYDSGTGKYTLSKIWRGLLDTVPQNWSSGDRLWFFTYGDTIPTTVYSGTMFSKIQSVASNEVSALSDPEILNIRQRSIRPYPPGHFRLNSSTTAVNITDGSNIVVNWASRNRVRQADMVFKQFDTDVIPEARTEYYIKFFNASNTLIKTVGPLTTQTYTYLNSEQVTDNSGTEPKIVTVQLYSKRDGLYSLYPQQRTLIRPTGTAPAPPAYTPGSETYTPPPADDAVSIGGIRVCTTAPTDGQTLIYNVTNNCYQPGEPSVVLGGDLDGTTDDAIVVGLQTRPLSSAAPAANDFIGWNHLTNMYEPKNVAVGSSGSAALSSFTDVPESHTANNTWEDIGDMTVAYTPPEISNLMATFICEITGNSASNEHIAFRFQLDGSSTSEVWVRSKDILPSNNEKHLIEIHTVFENVTANTSHSVKVQWHDNGSNLDVTIYNRRLTLVTCKSPYDSNFNPSVLSGLQYWFDTSQLTGFSNNDPVPQMTDFSGNARHFVAGTSPNTQGVFKTNQLNGLPSLRFTHDGNATTQTNTTYIGPNFLGTYTEAELFVVLKAAADPASSNLKGSYAAFGTDFNITHYPFTDGTVYDDFGSNVRKNTGNPSTNLATFNLYNVTTKANSWVSRINGTQFYSTTTNTVAWNSAPQFGGNANTDGDAGLDGDIVEVILFNRGLNSSERGNIRNYISDKYAV